MKEGILLNEVPYDRGTLYCKLKKTFCLLAMVLVIGHRSWLLQIIFKRVDIQLMTVVKLSENEILILKI